MTATRVVLVHGLWMRPFSMTLLARRLEHEGFATSLVGYDSWGDRPSRALRKLAAAVRDRPSHVVGHSLGGLIALATLEAEPHLPVSRVVCLGSPLCGSAAADGVARWPGIGRWLGYSRRLLHRGCRPWQGAAEVGAVAGTMGVGLGRYVGGIRGANDGVVGVAETRLPGLADHVEVHATHSGLVVSPAAARQVAAFIRDGRFIH